MTRSEICEVKINIINNYMKKAGLLKENQELRTHFNSFIKGVDIYTINGGCETFIQCESYKSLIDTLSSLQNFIALSENRKRV